MVEIPGGHRLQRIEVKKQIDQRVQDNSTISVDEIASEARISDRKKWFRSGARSKGKRLLLTGSENIWTKCLKGMPVMTNYCIYNTAACNSLLTFLSCRASFIWFLLTFSLAL
jgi:hypothetical protein